MLSSLPCTSKPSIHQHPSEAVMNLECMYLWISSILCSDSTATDAISGPLYTYLYKYLHDFTLLHISTLLWHCNSCLGMGCMGQHVYCLIECHFFNTASIISSSVIWVSISSKDFFHKLLGKVFCAFSIIHAWRLWITGATWTMHHKCCHNFVQFRKSSLIWNLSTISSYSSGVLGLFSVLHIVRIWACGGPHFCHSMT